ncbi:MAG TPA: PHP domain-containing protein [Thermoanaerobaculia bacterium]|nr:PHP domain-containing protein [Thermoanaerobaculia bacterium]
MTIKIDLHSHSTVSDGLDTPSALVEKMHRAGISALALTDHDALGGLPEAREAAARAGMRLIPGAEISADAPDGDDVHILALFVDEENAPFRRQLDVRQANRRRRGEKMAENIVAAGYAIDLAAIREDVGDGVWGRPHLARALVRAGHAKDNDDAFARFLHKGCPWWVAPEKWRAEEVVRAIREAGGVSSLAHAVWYKDPDGIVEALAPEGLDAIEVFHPDHAAAENARFAKLAERHGLLATAGSDFHGVEEKGKIPGAVAGDRRMLDALEDRRARRSPAAR